jgi:predicted nucleotidyltransferase
MDERADIINKVKIYGEVLKESDFPMKIDNIYLFGSYAKGNPHKDSDIDVAIVVSKWKGDYFMVMPMLWRVRRDVDIRIEPHVIVPQEDYAGFLNEIQRTGILIS